MFEEEFNFPEILIDGEVYLEIFDAIKLQNGSSTHIELTDNLNDDVAIFRIGDELFAVSNVCPHKHTQEIYDGLVENYIVSCPFHGWEFDLRTGENKNPKFSTKSLKTYTIIQKDNKLYIKKPVIETPKWMQNM